MADKQVEQEKTKKELIQAIQALRKSLEYHPKPRKEADDVGKDEHTEQ